MRKPRRRLPAPRLRFALPLKRNMKSMILSLTDIGIMDCNASFVSSGPNE